MFGLAACGGSEISESELERERAAAAQNARQQAEIDNLRQDLQEQKESESGSDAAGEPDRASTDEVPESSGQIPADARYCGSAYGDGSASCPFVENVIDDYYASGEANTFTSYSPTTGLTYTVTCNGSGPTVCTAGRAAVIYIP